MLVSQYLALTQWCGCYIETSSNLETTSLDHPLVIFDAIVVYKLKAIVLISNAVDQIPIIGQAARKKCKESELLNYNILENQSAKITMNIYNIKGFFFLNESVI